MFRADYAQQLRGERGWSRAHAAKVMGITDSALTKLERSENVPSLDTLGKMAEAYNVLPGDLLPKTDKIPARAKLILDTLAGLPEEHQDILLSQAIANINASKLLLSVAGAANLPGRSRDYRKSEEAEAGFPVQMGRRESAGGQQQREPKRRNRRSVESPRDRDEKD